MLSPPDRQSFGGTNRLIHEKSPYLLKHARNPVDWHPWGEEAFERARAEDRPIFLSIGYSTCHWCNVMEEESFSDSEVAALMNRAFVPVKVDREERPDVDNLYMSVCQVLTGHGGWPLTIIMTPDKEPFFAGTYFPRQTIPGRIGMMELIPAVMDLWNHRRQDAAGSARRIIETVKKLTGAAPGSPPGEDVLEAAFEELRGRFDADHGGFGRAPKFPTPHVIMFLLRYWRRAGNAEALHMAEKTLGMMCQGGIRDHLGGGFHRYSTDRFWRLPHFEKMLYDQALIVMALIEAFQATGKEAYARTARETLGFVMRELTSPQGVFYTALGADSEGGEGRFYLWGEAGVREALDENEADGVIKVFDIRSEGNFREESAGESTEESVLYLGKPLPDAAREAGLSEKEVRAAMEKLFRARAGRTRPDLDDKILADCNGLMIAALARAAQALGVPEYAHSAGRAADSLLAGMRDREGMLLHLRHGGDSGIPAMADDYAFLAWGLLELYEAVFDARYLDAAAELTRQFIAHHWDEDCGGFYLTSDRSTDLPVRAVEVADAALPSANSVALLNLLKLGRLTADAGFRDKAGRLLAAFGAAVSGSPSAHAMFLCALDFAFGPAYEVVVAGRAGAADTEELLKALRKRFIPNKVVVFQSTDERPSPVLERAGFAGGLLEGKAAAHICENFACKLPTTDAGKMLRMLGA